jgi:DNA-binding response OmpR family regulator
MSRILIIDDDYASCRTLSVHLGRQGHRVQLAHTFDDGLAAARADPPHLVILDHRMPGTSGLEGLPLLKREFPETPVIMVTAYDDRETVLQARGHGAADCLPKPLDINELDEVLARALASSRSAA